MIQLGLSTTQANRLLEKYGFNDVTEKKTGFLRKFFSPLYSPISLMLLGASFLSYIDGKIFDFYFILILYFTNYFIQKWQEFKADKAIVQLRGTLSFDVSTLRDGQWARVNAKHLVPGDRIRLGLGSIIPADAKVVSEKNLTVNESVLTGESLPKEKHKGDTVFSGAFITTGSLEAEITSTGSNTYFGKTIFSIEQPSQKSILERDMLAITRFLTIISLCAVFILSIVFLLKGAAFDDLLTLDLSMIIAGIPVALPAVMTIILSIGAAGLTKKMVVVRRLSALQDLANVNLLLTDKTGTLTKNQIRVVNVISYQQGLSTDDIVELASCAASTETPNAIDLAIIKRMEESHRNKNNIQVLNFIPYDSDRKRTTAFVQTKSGKILISLGAPQVIRSFDEFVSPEMKKKFEDDISNAAKSGYRVLALAIKKDSEEETRMRMAGLLFLADPLDESSKDVLLFMRQNGIDVKILTGDNAVITQRITEELGLPGRIIFEKEMADFYRDNLFEKEFENISAFAQILPNDKYEIVKAYKARHVVAATGDGVNDLPALRAAHVGIAVAGAVSALRSMADIVLLGHGLSVIRDAILESRKIFVRLYNYSVYRISESFRLIITILILGLAYGFYPLVPLQIIVLAFLNDLPIIALAFDRVKVSTKPSEIKTKERFMLSLMFGSVGVINSIILFILMTHIFHLSLPVIQTIFFLKLTVSGHSLIFVAHTKERWFRFLPSREVIIATLSTQAIATLLAVTGFLMPAKISFFAAFLVWVWALFWMQISDMIKNIKI